MLVLSPWLTAQQSTTQTIVTVTPKSKQQESIQKIQSQNVQVYSNSKQAELTGWQWAGNSRLQLMVLLDDSTSGSLGRQLQDIKSFIQALPPTTEVSVAYMQNGRAVPTQTFTLDHQAATKAVRMPLGIPGGNGSPYFVISDVAKKWPSKEPAARREILMISDGVNRYSDQAFDPNDPYFLSAIQDAQKAGIIVYSIYYRGAGMLDRNPGVTNGGQNYLTGLSQATGGHSYMLGLSNPVSLSPYLDDLSRRLQNQYELTFLNPHESKANLADLKVKIQTPGVEIEAPSRAPITHNPAGGR